MKEAQRQPAGAIADATQELPAAAKGDLRELHVAFDDCAVAVAQGTDGDDLRAVFVPQR